MTPVQEIIEAWQKMSRGSFDEYLLNNKETLIREEKENIMDAYDVACLKTEGHKWFDGMHYYNEIFTQ